MLKSTIVVPENWNPHQDLQHACDNWEIPAEEPAVFLLRHVAAHRAELIAVVDSACRRLQQILRSETPCAPEALSFLQKVAALERLADQSNDAGARRRLLDQCAGLRSTEEMRQEIIDRWLATPDNVRLLELGELGDSLCYARMELEQTVRYAFDEAFTYEIPELCGID